jgi:hypothetical protein
VAHDSTDRAGENADGVAGMPKHKRNGTSSINDPPVSNSALRKAMTKRTKAELVSILLDLAEADRRILRQLTAKLNVHPPPDELVAATRQAIIDATAFDERDMNRNFAYDYAAYDEVKRNLGRLTDSGRMREAMELSLELMKRGSYQVEMSDEGLMTEDIEDCLGVVLESLTRCDLPAQELTDWCSAMLRSDRVQYIATEQLQSLRKRFKMSFNTRSTRA